MFPTFIVQGIRCLTLKQIYNQFYLVIYSNGLVKQRQQPKLNEVEKSNGCNSTVDAAIQVILTS